MVKPIIREWDNMADFWEYLSKTPTNAGPIASTIKDRPTFTGTRTYDEAMELGRYGWSEGLDRVRPMVAQLEKSLMACIPDKVLIYDTAGSDPDVGAYLQGIPEHMAEYQHDDSNKRVLTLVVNTSLSGGISKESCIARGAALCAFVDAAEKAGVRIEVKAVDGTQDRRHDPENSVYYMPTLKKADEALSLDRMVFALAHPSYCRRLMFRAIELESPKAREAFGESYGVPCEVPKEYRGDIYIGCMHLDKTEWHTPAKAHAEVLRLLKQAGITITEER